MLFFDFNMEIYRNKLVSIKYILHFLMELSILLDINTV